MTTVQNWTLPLREMRGMAASKVSTERFKVASADSSLTFFATSSMQSAYGKTTEIDGYVEAAWNGDGTLATTPPPKMHVEFKVESLRTGNELQDREMWKLIDSKRFPKIFGDLAACAGGSVRGRYNGTGQVTLAGLARMYEGEFRLERDGETVKLEGELNVDVRDFGLKPISLLVLSVAPQVRVRLHLTATKSD